uniref:protein disulfide-isomerase n=1 Tax=Chelydra serpentina TaxID=8475 RepID=A0A8C3XJ70_CHESE
MLDSALICPGLGGVGQQSVRWWSPREDFRGVLTRSACPFLADAPWCGHCQALAPEFTRAAGILKNESAGLRLAKVDATEETDLSTEFGVTGYPVLKLFRDGNRTHPIDFTGRDAEGIVRWMRRKAGPSAELLQDEARAQEFIASQDVVVVGFFKDLQSKAAQGFYDVASDAVDVTFGVSNKTELFQKYSVTPDTVCLFKKVREGGLGLNKEELSRFIVLHSLELVMEFTSQNSPKIFGAKIHNHLLLFINKTLETHLEILGSFQAAAPPFRGQVLFVLIDVNGEGAQVLQYFGLKSHEAPTMRFINVETNKKYRMATDEFATQAVGSFAQAVLDGKVQPHLMSEEVPEDWDKHPVKVLVGKNFEQVAYDETKNVFVKFYAPWCTHCKEMAPVWEELGEKYKDHENIIIAKLDATVNEITNLTIRGYPTLHYFPAGPDRKVQLGLSEWDGTGPLGCGGEKGDEKDQRLEKARKRVGKRGHSNRLSDTDCFRDGRLGAFVLPVS